MNKTLERLTKEAQAELFLVEEVLTEIFHDSPAIGVWEEYELRRTTLEVHSDEKRAQTRAKAYAQDELQVPDEGVYTKEFYKTRPKKMIHLFSKNKDIEIHGELETSYPVSSLSVPLKKLQKEGGKLYLGFHGFRYEVRS